MVEVNSYDGDEDIVSQFRESTGISQHEEIIHGRVSNITEIRGGVKIQFGDPQFDHVGEDFAARLHQNGWVITDVEFEYGWVKVDKVD